MLDHRAPPPAANSPQFTPIPRLLLADDDAASRHLLGAVIEREGFAVTVAVDGVEAMERIAAERPDLVVLDFEMPRLDGAEVCAWLREQEDPGLRDVPVIMLTAHSDESDEVACLEAGANDFVTKPASRSALLARIRTQLRLRAMSDELRVRNAELARWRETHEADLSAARTTQRTLIPATPPDVPGWKLQSVYQPMIQVGGDAFGWRQLRDGRWLLWLADVTGHGAAAALLTTHTALLFNHAAERASSPAQLLDAVNREFGEVWQGRLYLTALCVMFDANGMLTVASAGHPPVLVKRANGAIESAGPHATMIGVLPEFACEETTLTLEPGDRALAFTDGLFSLKDPRGERLQVKDVQRAMAEESTTDLSALIRAVRRGSDGKPFDDDLAAVGWHRLAE